MDLFAALDYSGPENRTSVLLFSVLHHLSVEARDALLTGIVPSGLGRSDDLRPQHGVPVGVLDGWLLWSGRCAVVLEAKVDDALGAEQPERYATWLTTRDEPERVLWLATKESAAVAELLPRLKIPAGVRVVHTTWTVLADRAATNAASASEADSLLLLALARRLRSSGAAVPPRPALDRTALGLAVGRANGANRGGGCGVDADQGQRRIGHDERSPRRGPDTIPPCAPSSSTSTRP